MTELPPAPDGYRPCVGIMLVRAGEGIFVGERVDTPGAWQMPQGGIDRGETVDEALKRELEEETGVRNATLIRLSRDWRCYDLPADLARRSWGGRYRGQAQIWGLMRFDGQPDEIDLGRHHCEFRRWKWTRPAALLDDIVDFKRGVYAEVLREFQDDLHRLG